MERINPKAMYGVYQPYPTYTRANMHPATLNHIDTIPPQILQKRAHDANPTAQKNEMSVKRRNGTNIGLTTHREKSNSQSRSAARQARVNATDVNEIIKIAKDTREIYKQQQKSLPAGP